MNPPPKAGEITSQLEYAMPILESLIELGRRSKMSEVLDRVQTKLKDRLKPKDYKLLTDGVVR